MDLRSGTAEQWSGGRLEALSEEECWARLGEHEVGRLAWSGSEGITVVPVNYLAEDGVVLLRTTAYSAIARECDGADVAIEVDAIDERERLGWSVLVRGRCVRDLRHGYDDPAPRAWPSGPRTLHLRVEARLVTGRRLVRRA